MSRSRMFRDDEPMDSRSVSPRTTIVGGRPPETRTDLPPVPTGIQKLLRLASVDGSFREELLRRRGGIAPVAGVALTPSERAILGVIPAAQLDTMIAALPPPPADRRTFLRQTASTAVMLLGGAVLAECVSACKGHRADLPPSGDADAAGVADVPVEAGAAADAPRPPGPPVWEGPPPRPEDMPPPAGAQPDWPPGPSDEEPVPVRPDVNPMELEGGISPHVPEPADAGEPVDAEEPEIGRRDVPMVTRGIRPDEPPRPDHSINAPGGARPDVPLDRPDDRGMATTGGAAPDMPPYKK
ncbi:MAG: hypothetical protein HY905_25190 [Deltaproteobacteria bacterium]|nr:hypothetical protein [Deltaproteobacteria bacterium]